MKENSMKVKILIAPKIIGDLNKILNNPKKWKILIGIPIVTTIYITELISKVRRLTLWIKKKNKIKVDYRIIRIKINLV
jgi:hypothetical protein